MSEQTEQALGLGQLGCGPGPSLGGGYQLGLKF